MIYIVKKFKKPVCKCFYNCCLGEHKGTDIFETKKEKKSKKKDVTVIVYKNYSLF